jgi:ATP-binding cassette, subfamily B, bacterial
MMRDTNAADSGSDRGGIRRFLGYVRPVRGLLVAGMIASVFEAVMQWLAPWPLKFIFDSVLSNHPLPSFLSWMPATTSGRLLVLSVATLAIAAGDGIFSYVSNRRVADAGQRVVFAIRTALFRHLTVQSLGFHQRRRTGDLMSRLDGDIQQMQAVMVDGVPTVTNNIVTLTGFAVIMFLIDPTLGLATVGAVPFMYLLVRYFLRRIKDAQRIAMRAQGDAAATAQEVLTSLQVVQVFGGEEHEADRFGRSTQADLQSSLRAVVLQSAFSPLVAFTMTAMTTVVVFLGAEAVVAGHLTIGDLVVFTAYLRGMYSPIRQLAKLAGSLGRAHAAAERVAEVLDVDESVPQRPKTVWIIRARGQLNFENVHFGHAGAPEILDGIDLDVPAGSRLALVGPTGAGKSTLLRLIPRFIDPVEGSVRLDGIDLRDLDLADLRRQIALVPQEPFLFRGSVWENIAYGQPGANRTDAITAAKAAGVIDVIAGFSEGIDTRVAERGASLSGGQRQCIALARAMARDAPILLLDEPTTGLDAELQGVLLDAFDRIGEGRTTVMVSHQEAAIDRVDRVVALDDGRLTELRLPRELVGAHPFVQSDVFPIAPRSSDAGSVLESSLQRGEGRECRESA